MSIKCTDFTEVRAINIFSEIYGAYFRTTEKILARESVTEQEIYEIISENAFRDSLLFLPQKLIPKSDDTGYNLLKRNADNTLSPVTKNPPPKIVTELQKRWLKAKLCDPKFALFFSDDTLCSLNSRLSNVIPLYNPACFRYVDVFGDGDNFSDENYRALFRTVLSAVKKHEILEIAFMTGKNILRRSKFLPVKIEYSRKNDKFRVYCYSVHKNKLTGSGIINIGRIISAVNTHIVFSGYASHDDIFESRKAPEPVTVKVTTERNAVERFMMEFASYEKHTERNAENGECVVKIYFDKQDETELLIRLLGFGPVIEILGPEDFRNQARERITKQYHLLRNTENLS